ncbi:unnamed protein product [Prorocentrum cordatum]|uniref:Uncharacterized protein n=1 Tax=Prorocentrum cordatum TaxID=2364126 RepID=A0ABN9V747_9DINO|nr:unnamed protein product [Polarella glacialis]
MLGFLVKSKPALRRALKHSRNKLLDDLAQQMCSARSSHESRVEWKVLYQLQRFGGKRSRFQVEGLRTRRGPQGELLATSGDLSEAFTDYFAVVENGQTLSWEEFVERCNALPERGNVYPRELDMITPFRRLKHDIMKAAKRRGAGPDGLTNDLFQVAPQECTQILLPLFVEIDMASREPLLFKGTRPGMPLADLLFIIAFDPIIVAVNNRFGALGYLQKTRDVDPSQRIFRGREHEHAEEDVWDPAFMDDLVNGIELLDARLWKEAAISLVAIMYEETKSRGFTMNWKAGKTELMAFFGGTGPISTWAVIRAIKFLWDPSWHTDAISSDVLSGY